MGAKGIYNETSDVHSGACKGDSGGPLTQDDEDGRRTLIGIVSGGIDCGEGYPGWYTRVLFFKLWIQCIIDQSVRFNNDQRKVEEECKKVVEHAFFDLRGIGLDSEGVCREYYKTGTIVNDNGLRNADPIFQEDLVQDSEDSIFQEDLVQDSEDAIFEY